MVFAMEDLPENNGILRVEAVPNTRARAAKTSLDFSSSIRFHISFHVITSLGIVDGSWPPFKVPGEAFSRSLMKKKEFGSEAGAEM